MNHDQLREALSALHDGELGVEGRKEVLAHLNQCTECREAHRLWERIAATFMRAPQKPTRAETEFFVQKVMGRLEPEDSSVPAGWWGWMEDRLMVPALSMGLAALCLSILLAQSESMVPADTLLLVNANDHAASQWVLPSDAPDTGSLMFSAED